MNDQILDGWDLHVEGGSLVSNVHIDNIFIGLEIESGAVRPGMIASVCVTEKTTGCSYVCRPLVGQVASLMDIKRTLSSREAREWLSLNLILKQVGLSHISRPVARDLIMNGAFAVPSLDADKAANLRNQLARSIYGMKEMVDAEET